jgi:hypothetical protein
VPGTAVETPRVATPEPARVEPFHAVKIPSAIFGYCVPTKKPAEQFATFCILQLIDAEPPRVIEELLVVSHAAFAVLI